MRRRVSPRRRQAVDVLVASLVAGLVLAVTMAACSEEGDAPAADPGPEQPRSEPADPSTAAVTPTVRVTRVSGRLPAGRRDAVEATVRRMLAGYVEAAYLDGVGADERGATRRSRHRPVAAGGAFAAFTADTARQARRDRDLLTSAGFGDAEAVRPLEATAFLSVLAPEGRPLGATARTTLRFAVTDADGTTRRRLVRGRVLLTPQAGRWRIFGYELAGDAPVRAAR